MDIISHGLWGSIAFGRSNKKNFWLAFLFGSLPDFFSFGILWITILLGMQSRALWSSDLPPMEAIPRYVHQLYNVTHSFVIFAIAFAVMYAILRKPLWPMAAWGLHVVLDMFTHSKEFFATPFFGHCLISKSTQLTGVIRIYFSLMFYYWLYYIYGFISAAILGVSAQGSGYSKIKV